MGSRDRRWRTPLGAPKGGMASRATRATPPVMLAGAVLALTGVTVSGCAGAPEANAEAKLASSFEDLFSEWLAAPDATAYDKVVLREAIETGAITEDQYRQGLDLYLACMSEAGYQLRQTRYSTGVVNVQPPAAVNDVDKLMATDSLCQEKTSVFAVMGYETQQGNPDLLVDAGTVAYRCLKKDGLIADDVTVDQVAAFLTESHWKVYPFDVHDLGVESCFYAAGMAYQIDVTG